MRIEQPLLDRFPQADAEGRESLIDYDAYLRHKKAVAMRWFGYYKKCKDQQKKNKIIDQFNLAVRMRQR